MMCLPTGIETGVCFLFMNYELRQPTDPGVF
jgi:hypothetical protein